MVFKGWYRWESANWWAAHSINVGDRWPQQRNLSEPKLDSFPFLLFRVFFGYICPTIFWRCHPQYPPTTKLIVTRKQCALPLLGLQKRSWELSKMTWLVSNTCSSVHMRGSCLVQSKHSGVETTHIFLGIALRQEQVIDIFPPYQFEMPSVTESQLSSYSRGCLVNGLGAYWPLNVHVNCRKGSKTLRK